MFDYITCDYPLPLPKEAEELKSSPNWSEMQFQTKSIGDGDLFDVDSFMESYSIEEDGQIYKSITKREWLEPEGPWVEKDDGIEKIEHTGEIVFNNFHPEEKYDYWIEFSALFWKGNLKEIKLNEWKKEDNSRRLKASEELTTEMKRQREVRDSTPHKIKNFIKKPIQLLFDIVKLLLGLIVRLIWWMESKLL